jgi:hypothetical protein
LIFLIHNQKKTNSKVPVISQLPPTYKIKNFDFDDPLQKALLKETLNVYYDHNKADSIFQLYEVEYNSEMNTITPQKIEFTAENITQILLIYLKFILVYIFVLGLTYYAVQTFAIYRFVSKKQAKKPLLFRAYHKLKEMIHVSGLKNKVNNIVEFILLIIKAFLKVIFYMILFSPAYVIAYSFKTKFDTDSIIFMILLGVISNALLITYAQKFYTFLITESNKGYVETAIVKNLNNDYSYRSILPAKIFNLRKNFKGHVFDHIFMNANHQYYATIKEQAAFLITGLIIIEMALNIHGHLSYELMQNLLYQKYQLVLFIVFLIYLTVKWTEVFVDIFIYNINKKYQNK